MKVLQLVGILDTDLPHSLMEIHSRRIKWVEGRCPIGLFALDTSGTRS